MSRPSQSTSQRAVTDWSIIIMRYSIVKGQENWHIPFILRKPRSVSEVKADLCYGMDFFLMKPWTNRESGFSALLPMLFSHYMKKKSNPGVYNFLETRTLFNLGLCSKKNASHLSFIEMPDYLWQQSSCVQPGNFFPSCFPLLFFFNNYSHWETACWIHSL